MARIIFIEDDIALISGLTYALTKAGHEVTIASTCNEVFESCDINRFQLVILDITLPDGNGYEICESIRKKSAVPIIFLTARDNETDIIRGLDMGGDDYITKPFKLSVLLSRISAVLRRYPNNSKSTAEICSNNIFIRLLTGEVFKGSEKITLTAGEYKLLKFFMQNPDRILSSEQILANLWDCEERFINAGTLTVYIRRLRKKIEDDPTSPQKITTVRGMGYQWNSEVKR